LFVNLMAMHDRSLTRREALTLALAAAGTLVGSAGRAERLFAADQSAGQRDTEALRLLVRNALRMSSWCV
jgi:hypothetical protein